MWVDTERFEGITAARAFRNPASDADGLVIDLPDLHITATTSHDPTVAAILATFTYSKHDRALHSDAQPNPDWQTIHEAGVSARVPAQWEVRHVPDDGGRSCWRPVPANKAELGSDWTTGPSGPPWCELGRVPVDGFRLVGPPPESFKMGPPSIEETRTINGIAVGIIDVNADYVHSEVSFTLHNNKGETISGTIGAGPDPTVAAGILASLHLDS